VGRRRSRWVFDWGLGPNGASPPPRGRAIRFPERSAASALGENCLRSNPWIDPNPEIACALSGGRRDRDEQFKLQPFAIRKAFRSGRICCQVSCLPRHNLLPNVESSETFERAVLELVVIRLFSAVNKGECLRRHPVGRHLRWATLAIEPHPVRACRRGPRPTRAPAAGTPFQAPSTCRSPENFSCQSFARVPGISVGLIW
jgi:hypothetical protein